MLHFVNAAIAGAALSIGILAGSAVPVQARETVTFNGRADPGTIVVKTSERRLYLVLGDGKALRYRVAVGRAGKQWQGEARVNGKYVHPAWSPPDEVRQDNPNLPDVIPGGSPRNPMGPRALTLSGGEYAIHGTNRPESIGTSASYGCIRMYNHDILDLFDRVSVGTQVVVTR
jgi:lipoprotein-anchoring transpeptidase ErfK/SrfK